MLGALLIVTHNEGILRALATKLIVFHRGKIDVSDTGYDEFLEKIGWEDEDQSKGNGAQKKPTTRNNHNEKKGRAKAERREKPASKSSKPRSSGMKTH